MKELSSPLLDGQPFDLIVLNANGDNAVLKVRPPKEPFPSPLPQQGLYLFEYFEGEKLQVPFSSISKYYPFNDLLIDEAQRFLSQEEYASALRNFVYVYDRGGKSRPEVVNAMQRCLFEDALDNLRNKRFEFALSIFEDLYARDPKFRVPGIDRSLIEIILECHDGMIEQDYTAEDYNAVRVKTEALKAVYGKDAVALEEKWGGRIVHRVAELQQSAREEAAAGNGRMAHLRSRQAEQLAPGDASIKQMQVEILKQYPLIVIGTSQPPGDADGLRMEHWGARRAGRLTQRTLVELVGVTEEGGRYTFLNGSLTQIDEVGLKYAFDVNSSSAGFGIPSTNPYQVASRLLAAADPSSAVFNPSWQKILDRVQIDGGRVIVTLRVPFVKPEPLMRVPYEDPVELQSEESSMSLVGSQKTVRRAVQDGPYTIVEQQNRFTTYEPNRKYIGQPNQQHPVFIEQLFRNSSEAVDELIRGNIDVVDRVPPGDLERLKRSADIVVRPYSTPTVHVLVPKIRGDMKDNPFFRRGLSHGIDRATLLRNGICSGREVPGCEVLSGPFPVGTEENESIAYAYDPRVRPPMFSSHMASVLVSMSLIMDAQMKAKKAQEELANYRRSLATSETAIKETSETEQEKADKASLIPKNESGNPQAEPQPKAEAAAQTPPVQTPPSDPAAMLQQRTTVKSPAPNLVLAHPASSTATEAARSIAAMWSMLGVPTTTLALPLDEAIPSHDDWDVLYVEMVMEEPLTDIMKLVGRDGLASEVSSVADQTLQQLAFSGSWRLSNNLLRRLHRQLTIDLAIIPLYQVKEHYAYRNTVTGIGRGVVHLYQNAERWKIDVFASSETD